MGNVQILTRNTTTSTEAIAKRAADAIREKLPELIRHVATVDKASALRLNVAIKPAGRTQATKDPEVLLTYKPDYGEECVVFKARLTGEGDDAQLSLISELVQGEVEFEEDQPKEKEAATG